MIPHLSHVRDNEDEKKEKYRFYERDVNVTKAHNIRNPYSTSQMVKVMTNKMGWYKFTFYYTPKFCTKCSSYIYVAHSRINNRFVLNVHCMKLKHELLNKNVANAKQLISVLSVTQNNNNNNNIGKISSKSNQSKPQVLFVVNILLPIRKNCQRSVCLCDA